MEDYKKIKWEIFIIERFVDCENNQRDIAYTPFIFDSLDEAKHALKVVKDYFLNDENKYKDVFSDEDIKINNNSLFVAIKDSCYLEINARWVYERKEITTADVIASECSEFSKNKPLKW